MSMTRKPYTDQEAFDTAARHLLTQNKVCFGPSGACAYRGGDGMKCAVGALIDDADYHPSMDRGGMVTVGALFREGTLPSYLRSVSLNLLNSLQNVHDRGDAARWPSDLREVAANFDLSPAVLDEVRS